MFCVGDSELRRRAVLRYMLYIHRALGDVVAQRGEADGQRVKDWIQYLLPGLMRCWPGGPQRQSVNVFNLSQLFWKYRATWLSEGINMLSGYNNAYEPPPRSHLVAPSGRPLSAFANGSIAFNSKVSGVPDLLLNLSTGGKGAGMGNRGDQLRSIMERVVFHPCVRLNRWKADGAISFIPPDGRFVPNS